MDRLLFAKYAPLQALTYAFIFDMYFQKHKI